MRKKITIPIDREPLFLVGDIAYGLSDHWFGNTCQSLTMNVIRPQRLPETPRPLVLWLCGGAWQMMDKYAHIPELQYLAEKGYIVASAQYRSSNEGRAADLVADVKKALRFLRAHAARFGIDPGRVALMGESAGAHLAVLTAMLGPDRSLDTGDYLDQSSQVQAVINWYGPSDLTVPFSDHPGPSPEQVLARTLDYSDPVFGQISPITYAGAHTPPMLLLHGNRDAVVPFSQSEALYQALIEKGACAELYELEGANHADIHFSQPGVRELILDFLGRKLP